MLHIHQVNRFNSENKLGSDKRRISVADYYLAIHHRVSVFKFKPRNGNHEL